MNLAHGIISFRNTIAGIIGVNKNQLIIGDGYAILDGQYISAEASLGDALRCSTYTTCEQKISSAIGEVPFIAERKYITNLFKKPNDWQTGNEFNESITVDYMRWGETFIEKIGVNPKSPMQLIPHNPKFVKVRLGKNGLPEFVITQDSNRVILLDKMIWVRDLSTTSIDRRSRRDALGLQIKVLNATDMLANVLMQRGIFPSYVIESAGKMGDDVREKNSIAMKEFSEGGKKTGGVLQLEDGMKLVKAPGMTLLEAQVLETRFAFKNDIANAYGVPPFLAGGKSDTKYNNMAQQIQHMHRNGVSPILTKFVTAFSMSLGTPITADDRILQKGNYNAESDTVIKEHKGGIITANEGRARLGYEPLDGEDANKLNPPTSSINIMDSDQQTNPEDIEE